MTDTFNKFSGDMNQNPMVPQVGGMRLALMTNAGVMKSIWVQSSTEGKYFFESKGEHEDYSFLGIEVFNRKISVKCYKKSYIMGEDGSKFSELELQSGRLLAIVYKGRQYRLYSEAAAQAGNVFHNYFVPKLSEITIGRTQNNDIMYNNPMVSKSHAVLKNTLEGWVIQDTNSTNGIYVNGRHICDAKLFIGDRIYIMGLNIIVGIDFLSINNQNELIKINPTKLIYVTSPTEMAKLGNPSPIVVPKEHQEFNRLPRRRKVLETDPIEIEGPPMSMKGNNMPLVLRMGSSAVMGGRSIMMGSYSMALTSLVFPLLTQRYTEKERKEYEAKRTELYNKYLETKKNEIKEEKSKEVRILNDNYPDLARMLSFIDTGDRLWERRIFDDDFMKLRIGTGTTPMVVELDYPKEHFEMEEDELETAMYDLVKQEHVINNVPILADFVEEFVSGVLGSRYNVLEFVKRVIIQLCVSHSSDEVKTIFLINSEELEQFEFIKYLPHTWNNLRDMRFIATSKIEASKISEYLKKEIEEDLGGKPRKLDIVLKKRPFYMVFAFDKTLYEGAEVLKDILGIDKCIGVSILTMFDDLPKECFKIFRMNDKGQHMVRNLRQIECPDQIFHLDYLDANQQNTGMKKLANIKVKLDSAEFALPKMVTFLEMFGVGRIEHLNIQKRWQDNNPVKSLATPIGVATDGSLFTLDLHEKKQGPHGLVAGMTGSGKSEIIITYILSMAVNYHPDEVAFILIDYKGGGLAGAFEDEKRGVHLPHLVGTITNLDGAAITRSLASIQSELKRRQAIFNKARSDNNEGTMDIYDYQKLYRAGKVVEPLPHLFIISDEFAELKAQQPEFMDQLISAARIGRSLGVHLILATQKPAGVVNDQILSNTKFRVCLRVQDKLDSMDMLKRPEAAELKDTGRFYLQVGYNEFFALGQSAWCGADYEPQDEVIKATDEDIRFIDATGQTSLKAAPEVKRNKTDMKQIVAIVNALTEIAIKENIHPKPLWTPPLENLISYEDIFRRFNIQTTEMITAKLGILDDPDHQRQLPLIFDVQNCQHLFIVGESGCGKTTMVQTMLFSLVNEYSPEDVIFYILDFSSHNLNIFAKLPHCGVSLDEEHENDIERFFVLLQNTINERKKLFAEVEVSSFEAYRQVAKLPLMLVIIDSMEGLSSLAKGNLYFSSMSDFMRDAGSYGIKFIITGNHTNAFSTRMRQEGGTRIALRAKDKFAYQDILNIKVKSVPSDVKGRGLYDYDGTPLEFHTAMAVTEGNDQERMQILKKKLKNIENKYNTNYKAPSLSMIREGETYEDFCEGYTPGRIPLGYSAIDIRKIYLPFYQMYNLSLYFGNEIGFKPIIKNYIQIAAKEKMRTIIVKRKACSIMTDTNLNEMLDDLYLNVSIIEPTLDDIKKLQELLIEEIGIRKAVRNEYFEQNGIVVVGTPDADTMAPASKYIRTKTTPMLILFESFIDFVNATDEAMKEIMGSIFENGKGYNFYFIGCFRPGEGARISLDNMFKAFKAEQLAMLYGGQFDKQGIVMLPSDYSAVTSPAEKYNNAILSYRGKFYPIITPCGELDVTQKDIDEEPII